VWLPGLLALHTDYRVTALTNVQPLDVSLHAFRQGSARVAELLAQSGFALWVFSGDITCSLPSPPCFQLYHPEYGGVTDGSWGFWGHLEAPPPLPLAEWRTLFHALDKAAHVKSYTPCEPLPLCPREQFNGWSQYWR
jgi:hypothetical protein